MFSRFPWPFLHLIFRGETTYCCKQYSVLLSFTSGNSYFKWWNSTMYSHLLREKCRKGCIISEDISLHSCVPARMSASTCSLLIAWFLWGWPNLFLYEQGFVFKYLTRSINENISSNIFIPPWSADPVVKQLTNARNMKYLIQMGKKKTFFLLKYKHYKIKT